MNTIKQFHQNYFSVSDPSDAVIARAKQLASGNRAKINAKGTAIFQNSYKREIKALIAQESHDATVVSVDLSDGDETDNYDPFNKYEAKEQFDKFASLYRALVNARAKGRDAHNAKAEALAAKIETGITVSELESWLIDG